MGCGRSSTTLQRGTYWLFKNLHLPDTCSRHICRKRLRLQPIASPCFFSGNLHSVPSHFQHQWKIYRDTNGKCTFNGKTVLYSSKFNAELSLLILKCNSGVCVRVWCSEAIVPGLSASTTRCHTSVWESEKLACDNISCQEASPTRR